MSKLSHASGFRAATSLRGVQRRSNPIVQTRFRIRFANSRIERNGLFGCKVLRFARNDSALGFTIVEVLVAAGLFALIGSSFIATYLTGERLVRQGLSMAKAQSLGRIGMEKIERDLRMAVSALILSSGDRIQFVVDTNANPYAPNLVTRQLYFGTGDGDETTPNDNTMSYDPNLVTAGDEEIVMTNVRRLPGNSIFVVSGKMISVSLRVSDVLTTYNSASYAGSDVNVSTRVYMRN